MSQVDPSCQHALVIHPGQIALKVYEPEERQVLGDAGEIWKAVDNLLGCFEVSNFGRVRSLPSPYDPDSGPGGRTFGKILKTTICGKGHERLTVLSQGEMISLRVNWVVATAFVANPHNLPYVRHKDTNKLNNQADNLEWTDKRQRTARPSKSSQSEFYYTSATHQVAQ